MELSADEQAWLEEFRQAMRSPGGKIEGEVSGSGGGYGHLSLRRRPVLSPGLLIEHRGYPEKWRPPNYQGHRLPGARFIRVVRSYTLCLGLYSRGVEEPSAKWFTSIHRRRNIGMADSVLTGEWNRAQECQGAAVLCLNHGFYQGNRIIVTVILSVASRHSERSRRI